MILMNHSCWIIDLAQESVNGLRHELDCSGVGLIPTVQLKLAQKQLKKVVDATCDVIEYQKKTQNLLQLSFLMEFSLLSIVLCMSLTSLHNDLSDYCRSARFSTFVLHSFLLIAESARELKLASIHCQIHCLAWTGNACMETKEKTFS